MDNKRIYELTKPPYIPILKGMYLIDGATPKQFGIRKLNKKGVTRWCYIKDLLGKQNGYGEE